ncbi:hypothetical protein NPIL_213901 [Nephila pilipes]|uniref:Uncharacterized protein n=1 Tax=Nephila pilipes TaxID=299642 RepID=A0A8X6TVI5_NEPPI|nr:hypothetical protein NPIL_213901 [Nephila pilipes]
MHVPTVYYMPKISFLAITREDELICWIRTAGTEFQLESLVFQTRHSPAFYVVTPATSWQNLSPPASYPSWGGAGDAIQRREGDPLPLLQRFVSKPAKAMAAIFRVINVLPQRILHRSQSAFDQE